MRTILKLSNLAVECGGNTLLSGLGCAFNAGEVVVVLGPNGAGKSSLLLALAGLTPASGTVELFDKSLGSYSRSELSRQIAWQGELPPTEFGLTVRQRLELTAIDEAGAIESTAAAMDIALLLQRPLGELSSGERQRVELAALMLREVPIWLLDEPTTHLDLKHQTHCLKMIKKQAASGRAIITVLHDLQQAAAVADFIILIDGKGSAECGPANQIFTIDRLLNLFDTPLIGQGKLLIPDYGDGA